MRDYTGREQSYVKHVFLERYLETLAHKTASTFARIAYVDGFAGPWQSTNEQFQDTSFGIALDALRRAKASWKERRDVQMSAFLVERDADAYRKLTGIKERYSDISIETYPTDFMNALPSILRAIPSDAFTFFLIDPKGWRLPLAALEPLLSRRNSEVVFNFMFDFINRAVNIKDPVISTGLDELIPYGDWRAKLEMAERAAGSHALTPDERRALLVEAFRDSLLRLGNYQYVAEMTIFRPLIDRALYCLFYATRHQRGIEVFRDCQIKALREQSATRAETKVKHAAFSSGQRELFQSLHDMAPDEVEAFLRNERDAAEKTLLEITPEIPGSRRYEDLWPQVLARCVVRRPEVNEIAARLRSEGRLLFPDWERSKRVPQGHYRAQRP